jgi:putative oxidoreductase
MKSFPFVSPTQSIAILRVSVAFIFLTHSIVRIFNSSIPQFGGFLESKGFPGGEVWVWAITAFEIVGGILLALGIGAKWLGIAFITMLMAGIVLIHAAQGWFVGEHGTGGVEFSFILISSLLVVVSIEANESGTAKEPME